MSVCMHRCVCVTLHECVGVLCVSECVCVCEHVCLSVSLCVCYVYVSECVCVHDCVMGVCA